MPSIGAFELLLILGIVVMIFGIGRLPEVGNALGKGIREFKSATTELEPAAVPATTTAVAEMPATLAEDRLRAEDI